MSNVIDSLMVELGLDSDVQSFRKAETMFNSVRSAALQFATTVGGGIGLHQLTIGAAGHYEQLGRFSDRLGVTAQYASALGYALEQSGGQASDAFGAIESITGILDGIRMGDMSALEGAARWGLDPSVILEAKDAADAMERLSIATSEMNRMQLRNTLGALSLDSTIDLFAGGHDNYRELIEEFNRTRPINDNLIGVSQEFNSELTRLNTQIGTVADAFSEELLPQLTEASKRFREFLGDDPTNEWWFEDLTLLFREGGEGLGRKYGEQARDYLADQIGRRMPSEESTFGRFLHRIDQNAARISGGMSSQDPVESTNKVLEWLLQGKASGSLVDSSLMEALAMVESGGRHRDSSGNLITNPASGARGRYQIMPDTARDPGYGVMPLHNDSQAEHRRFAEDYLAAMLAEFGDIEMALAAYNWGPGNVRRHGEQWRDHAPRETLDYVPKVLNELRRLEATAPSRDDVLEEFYRQPSPTDLGFRSSSDQPSPAAVTGQPASPGTLDMGGFTIHIHDATDPQGTAREVERQIRKLANMAIDDFREPYV